MGLRTALAGVLAGLALTAPVARAAAPILHTDQRRSCYYATGTGSSRVLTDTAKFIAAGFPPNIPVTVAANEIPLRIVSGVPRSDAYGNVYLAVRTPPLSGGEQIFWLNVMGAGLAAGHVISVTDFAATVTPSARPGGRALSPRRPVRIQLNGWGGGRTVYLHFVPPRSRRAVRTVRVARTSGACGHATVHLRHFWPFTPRRAGAWRLQFDVRRAYDPANRLAVSYQSLIAF